MFSKLLKLILIPILFAGIVLMQVFYDGQKAKATYFEPTVMKPEVVRAVDLGLHNAAADLMWLSAIQYVGGWQSRTYEKLDDYLFLSTDLDPKFSYPYAFGVLMLPSFKQTGSAIKLGEKGIANSEPDWRIPYYTATTYHIDLGDTKNAAKYFDIAARTKGAPDNIKRIAANYGSRPDLREQTKQIWIGIMENSNDEVVIERAKAYVVHYEILDLLENSVKIYKDRNGKYPEDINDLVKANILRTIPQDPFGFEYKINAEGRAEIK